MAGKRHEPVGTLKRLFGVTRTSCQVVNDMQARYRESNPISSGTPDYAPETPTTPATFTPPQTRSAAPPAPPAPGASTAPSTTSSSVGQTALR